MTNNPSQPVRPPRRILARVSRLLLRCLIPIGALLGATAGGAYGVMKPPQYTATSYVIAVPAGEKKADPAAALGFAQAYGRVVTQLAVLGDAQVWAGVPVKTLRKSVQAATSPDAPMVAITATSGRPDQATDMADAVSRALTEQVNRTKNDTGVGLVRLSRALKPTEPSSLSPTLTSIVGASAGGLLGGLALLARPRRVADGERERAQVPGPALAADAHGTL
ncbi:lipopolysaccharide biosynthesis protein [Streptomyces sp. NPDC058476]|uniref:lipopolysaccharide biosynthesis protein n=1 Tax=Streptomyces sp. NPDC058476 TaxID=3346519 RepID=UPI0036611DCB